MAGTYLFARRFLGQRNAAVVRAGVESIALMEMASNGPVTNAQERITKETDKKDFIQESLDKCDASEDDGIEIETIDETAEFVEDTMGAFRS